MYIFKNFIITKRLINLKMNQQSKFLIKPSIKINNLKTNLVTFLIVLKKCFKYPQNK